MKKTFLKLCLLAYILLFSVACSRSEKLVGNEFLIEGKVSGVEDGTIILLLRKEVFGESFIASDTVKNGRFTFKGETVSNPEQLNFVSFDEGFIPIPAVVWVAPKTKIKIKGNEKLHQLWEVKSSVPYQKEENRYTNENRDVIAEFARNRIEIGELRIKASSEDEEALAYRKVLDSLNTILRSLVFKRLNANISIMEKTDITPVWFNKMTELTSSLLNPIYAAELREKALELYGKMSEEDKNTPEGYKITNFLFPPIVVGVGDDMADTDLLDENEDIKNLVEYLGKYLLLDFWSIGCGPCIMALPEMKEISEIYHDKLTIISISLDTENWWKKAMNEHDMPWVNIRDPKSIDGLATDYGVRSIPYYIMISPEGKVVDKWAGYRAGYLKTKVGENIK